MSHSVWISTIIPTTLFDEKQSAMLGYGTSKSLAPRPNWATCLCDDHLTASDPNYQLRNGLVMD